MTTTYRLWLASKLAQPMLDSKTGCCLGNADARQQGVVGMEESATVTTHDFELPVSGFLQIVCKTCIFSPRSSVL